MTQLRRMGLVMLLLVTSGAVRAWCQDEAEAVPEKSEEPAAKTVPWHANLAPALEDARRRNVPVLVRVGADWCPWCHKLDEEIDKPAVQEELARWALANLDADDVPEEVRQLRVGPIPALRVLDSTGRIVASRDGYMPADRLVQWLQKVHDQNPDDSAESIANLASSEPATLLQLLGHRNPATREAAIRKAIPDRQRLAVDVVGTLHHGKLASRISAMELLNEWHAPLTGLDPWKPETITTYRLKELEDWAELQQSELEKPKEPEPLTDEKRSELRAEIDRLLAADPAEAEAIGSRLARYGAALLPDVGQLRDEATTDAERQRLEWLRLRILASDQLALDWPGGLMRLASPDASVRRDAASELALHVTSSDVNLLNELFRHPDANVRELGLKSLGRIGRDAAIRTLEALLDDPEPNVRSAALKYIADAPKSRFSAVLTGYVTREKDIALLVNSIRIMREIHAEHVKNSLVNLLDHPSWQVRAEAIEALGAVAESNPGEFGALGTDEDRAKLNAKIIKAIEDPDAYVVSRAIEFVEQQRTVNVTEPLIRAAERHPELAESIVKALSPLPNDDDDQTNVYQRWLSNSNPVVRAAALRLMYGMQDEQIGSAFLSSLSDADLSARITAARLVFDRCALYRPLTAQSNAGVLGSIRDAALTTVLQSDGNGQPIPSERQNRLHRLLSGKSIRAPLSNISQADVAPEEQWLIDFRSGTNRPDWTRKAVEPLVKLLRSDEAEERIAAAVALIPLGREDVAFPVLRECIGAQPKYVRQGAFSLSWLPWDRRKEWFDYLIGVAATGEETSVVVDEMAASCDLRVTTSLWELLANPNVTAETARSVISQLAHLHGVFDYGESNSNKPVAMGLDELRQLGVNGKEGQKLAAALLLVHFDRASATTALDAIIKNESVADRRNSALNAILLIANKRDATQRALSELESSDDRSFRLSLAYLARGIAGIIDFHTLEAWIPDLPDFERLSYRPNPNDPPAQYNDELPAGLSRERLAKFATAMEGDTAAHAGYLLARLGDSRGVPPLIARWRSDANQRLHWNELLIAAILSSDATKHFGVFTEIYDSERDSVFFDVRKFYSRIESLSGPEVSALRQRIRDDVGEEVLRQK